MDRPLSALELTALGIVLKQGPCVGHTVVRQFSGSRTSAYHSGAGSIYPLLKRLAEAGLLRIEGRMYSLADAGRDALRDWVRPPFQPSDFCTSLDELRSRAYFLTLLSPEERARFAESALQGLEELLAHCRETLDAQRSSGDKFGELAMLGAVRETEARIGWIEEIRAQLPATQPRRPS